MCRERPTRRGYLAALAAVGAGSIAGCPGGGSTDGSTETPAGETDSTDGAGGTPAGPTDSIGGTDLSATPTARTDRDTATTTPTPPGTDTATTTPTPPGTDTATSDVALETAKRAARDLEHWRSARVDLVRDLSSRTELTDGSREQQQSFLEGRTSRYADDVHRLHLFDRSDRVVRASSSPAKQGDPLNAREAPWKHDEISYGDDGVFVARAVEAHARSIVSFVAPVEPDADGELALVLMSDVDRVGADLPTTGEDGRTTIVDDRGRVVGGTREVDPIARNDGTLEHWAYWSDDGGVLEPGFDGEAGVVESGDLDGARDYGAETEPTAFAPVDGLPWVVVVQVPLAGAGSGSG